MFCWTLTLPSASAIVHPNQTITINPTDQHKILNIYFYLFSIFIIKHKRKQRVSYKGGNVASIAQIYTRTTVKNHNENTALEKSVIIYWWGGD